MDEHTNVLSRTLKDRMEREAELFRGLQAEVERLRVSLQEKDWNTALAIAQGMEHSAKAIEKADGARDESFVLLRDRHGPPPGDRLLRAAPAHARTPRATSWRRAGGASHDGHPARRPARGRLRYSRGSARRALNRILERIFPYRKGKIYSRSGKTTSVDGALLVDHTQ